MLQFLKRVTEKSLSNRNNIFLLITLVISCLLFIFIEYPKINIEEGFCQVTFQNPLGCSPLGEDIVSLLLWGSLKTIGIAFCARLFAILAVIFGSVLTFYFSTIETLFSRFTEAMMTIPSLLLALAFGFSFGASPTSTILAVAIAEWSFNQKWMLGRMQEYARFSYVSSSQAMGASKTHLLKFHLKSSIKQDSILLFFIYFPTTILSVASLEFLGLTSNTGIPGLGYQISAYKDYVSLYPNIVLPAMVTILLIVFTSQLVKRKIQKSI